MIIKRYQNTKIKRAVRVRAKLKGTAKRPRLSLFRSGKHLLAQLIDDTHHQTLLGLNTQSLKSTGTKTAKAALLGEQLASQALKKDIKAAIVDRGAYRFHGRLQALVAAARQAGLKL